jgi:hypothetical protein
MRTISTQTARRRFSLRQRLNDLAPAGDLAGILSPASSGRQNHQDQAQHLVLTVGGYSIVALE